MIQIYEKKLYINVDQTIQEAKTFKKKQGLDQINSHVIFKTRNI